MWIYQNNKPWAVVTNNKNVIKSNCYKSLLRNKHTMYDVLARVGFGFDFATSYLPQSFPSVHF